MGKWQKKKSEREVARGPSCASVLHPTKERGHRFPTQVHQMSDPMQLGNQRKGLDNDGKYDGMCEKCCDAERGNIELQQYVDIIQGVAQECTPIT